MKKYTELFLSSPGKRSITLPSTNSALKHLAWIPRGSIELWQALIWTTSGFRNTIPAHRSMGLLLSYEHVSSLFRQYGCSIRVNLIRTTPKMTRNTTTEMHEYEKQIKKKINGFLLRHLTSATEPTPTASLHSSTLPNSVH